MTDLQTMRAIVAKADNPDVEIQKLLPRMTANYAIQEWVDINEPIDQMIQSGYKFRIKPQTITLNGRELPAPSGIDLDYSVRVDSVIIHNRKIWYFINTERFEFDTESDAQAWVDALNELMGEGK